MTSTVSRGNPNTVGRGKNSSSLRNWGKHLASCWTFTIEKIAFDKLHDQGSLKINIKIMKEFFMHLPWDFVLPFPILAYKVLLSFVALYPVPTMSVSQFRVYLLQSVYSKGSYVWTLGKVPSQFTRRWRTRQMRTTLDGYEVHFPHFNIPECSNFLSSIYFYQRVFTYFINTLCDKPKPQYYFEL